MIARDGRAYGEYDVNELTQADCSSMFHTLETVFPRAKQSTHINMMERFLNSFGEDEK